MYEEQRRQNAERRKREHHSSLQHHHGQKQTIIDRKEGFAAALRLNKWHAPVKKKISYHNIHF